MAEVKKEESGKIEDIKFTEVKKSFDPLNTEPITENLRKDQFAPPPPQGESIPFEPIPEPNQQQRPNANSSYFGGSAHPPKGATIQQEPINPDFQEMPDAEKEAAAEQAAEMILGLYGGIKASAPKLIIITERKLKKMEQDGLINLSLPMQRSPNDPTRVTIVDIVKNFNASVSDGYTVTEEFKAQVRPALIRVLKKKGIGLTDEQFLLFAFGQDLVQTGFHLIAGIRQRNEVLNQLKDIYSAVKASNGFGAGNSNMATSPPPPPPPQPQPQHQQKREPEERVHKSDNFEKANVVSSENGKAGNGETKPELIVVPSMDSKKTRRSRVRKKE